MEKLGADGFNVVQNNGPAAGQTVLHFHIHVIPRRPGDGVNGWPALPGAKEPVEDVWRRVAIH